MAMADAEAPQTDPHDGMVAIVEPETEPEALSGENQSYWQRAIDVLMASVGVATVYSYRLREREAQTNEKSLATGKAVRR